MARLRTNVLKWGTKEEGPNNYKHGRRGALDDAFWDEDELVDYQAKKNVKAKKKAVGCEGNDGKAHVYLWVTYRELHGVPPRYVCDERYEYKVCCGCGKRPKRTRVRLKMKE